MDPNDPLHRDDWRQDFGADEARSTNATWGWVAAAVFVAVVLFIAFTSGHTGTQTASNDMQPSASRMITPSAPAANPADTSPNR